MLICSHDDIWQAAQDIRQELGYNIKIINGELSDAIRQVRLIMNEDPKRVLISRGGTALALKEKFSVPLIEIQVTGFDILDALYPYGRQGVKVAVIGYENVINGAKKIAQTLQMDILYLSLQDPAHIYQKLQEAGDAGIQAVVGDYFVERCAREAGFLASAVSSGKEAVRIAVETAKKLWDSMELERMKQKRYAAILEVVEEGVIAIDEAGLVVIFNKAAERLFDINKGQVMGKRVDKVIPPTKMIDVLQSKEAYTNHIRSNKKYTIASNIIPILDGEKCKGVVSSFRDITEILKLEEKIRAEIHKKGFHAKRTFSDICYQSEIMTETVKQAEEFAKTESTILIYGESGTGKEIMAQAIHNASKRRNGPFVAINCAALPDNLLESELFGYTEGSFTGAKKSGKKGLFEIAHRGTIFLDEISEMDLKVQARMLRVIQEREVMPLGSDQIIPVDVRIIAATNRDLWTQVGEGLFREDLYYRLNVLDVTIPPLRERQPDILLLAELFLERFAKEYNKTAIQLNSCQKASLLSNQWEGNIRQLQNLIERFVITGRLHMERRKRDSEEMQGLGSGLLTGTLAEIEHRVIQTVLAEEGFHKTNTAKRLQISRATLERKLKQ